MAFIREYSIRSQYAAAGDPFSLKRPKWMRKFKPGKALAGLARGIGRIAGAALPLIPGIPGFGAKVVRLLQSRGVPPEVAVNAARAYGLDVSEPGEEFIMPGEGDAYEDYGWMGDPGKPTTPKRKTAGAGGKVKAARKKATRQARPKKRHASSARGGQDGALESITGAIMAGLPGVGKYAGAVGELGGKLGGGLAGLGMPKGFGRHHRRVNPANVKALRRSIRRLEGFEKLVKHVQKAYPRLRHASASPSARGGRGRGGHRAGCGCAVCRRAA